jgi:Dihydroorotate dehydrogenase
MKDLDDMGNILLNKNIKLVIISNTSDSNRENLNNINKLEKGGLSGKPIEEKSNLLINEFYKKFQNKIKIIGVGGIDSGKSAYEKFISGASYIQLYTGMIYQGPNIVNKISEELYEILSSNGVKNIDEIIGSK